jgi:hypothetical protein
MRRGNPGPRFLRGISDARLLSGDREKLAACLW